MRDTIDMAREAGAELAELPMMDAFVFSVDDKHWNSKELERFVALVRADEREEFQRWFDAVTTQHKQEILAEREACAKLVDDIEARCIAKDVDDPPLEHIATAIRARGAKHD